LTYGCWVEFRFALCSQQPIRFLTGVGQLRIAKASDSGTVQDGVDQLAVFREEGIATRHGAVAMPGFARLRRVTDASELGQHNWLVCALRARKCQSAVVWLHLVQRAFDCF